MNRFQTVISTLFRFLRRCLPWLLLPVACDYTLVPVIPGVPVENVRPNDTSDTETANDPFAAGTYHVYYGDFHNHSNLSDGSGSPRDAYDYARDTAGFDFFSLSDHDFLLTEETWQLMKATADSCNEDSAFVALWGFEWTSWTYDHCTVIGSEEYCNSAGAVTTFTELCAWLSTRRAFAFFNHPGRLGSNVEFNRFSDLRPVRRYGTLEQSRRIQPVLL